jgi:hypothetical protein
VRSGEEGTEHTVVAAEGTQQTMRRVCAR